MNNKRINELKNFFYRELTENTMPFWINKCLDEKYGGIYTSVDRRGNPLSTHKAMWIQSRFVWLLSKLYSDLEPNSRWLDLASVNADFVRNHGFDNSGRMYFTVDRDGKPIRMRRYLFTEVFAVIGFAEYYRASGDVSALNKALQILELINKLIEKPGSLESKYLSENFDTMGHSMAMIQINMLQVLREAHPEGNYSDTIDSSIENILTNFVKPGERALLETVAPDGSILRNTPEGRLINPGHSIETAWFMLEEGKKQGNKSLIDKALPILDWSLERGWDPEYGGIFNFVDLDGRQPLQIEWDMKFWWPHNESIYATLLAYSLTGNPKYEEWFEKIFSWSENYFPDHQEGEWYGYLHRNGSVALDLKASGWKGPFHLPRQQLYCYLLLEEMSKKKSID